MNGISPLGTKFRVSGTIFGTALLAILSGPVFAQQDLASMPTQSIQAASAPLLETVPVGIASMQTWVDKVDLFQAPGKGSWRLMLARKQTRDERHFTLATLDLDSGTVTDHPDIPGYGVSKSAWSGGKLYFGTWLPGGFYVYDPESNAVSSLGQPFADTNTGPYRMSVSPDGAVSLGAGGGPVEVSVYDPKKGTLTRYGNLSEAHNFVYELGSDDRYVYAALRGRAPWELVAVNKATRERKVLAHAPLDGYINVSRTIATVTDHWGVSNAVHVVYDLKDGQAIPRDPAAPPVPASVPATPAPVPPKVVIDDSPLLEGRPEVVIHYQEPAASTNWRKVTISAPVASEGTLALTVMEDGRLAALAGPYNPAVVFDPRTQEGKQAPFRAISGRSMVAIGPVIYATGYPSTVLVRWDTSKPLTDRIDIPGKAFLPDTASNANPRTCATWVMGPNYGGHMGVRMFKGPGGILFICTARHRYARGYDVVWYDPSTDTKGEIEDSGRNDHLALTWASLLDGERKLIAATTVETNNQLTSSVPESGKLIVVDLETRSYTNEYVPLPGLKALSGIVDIGSNRVVGLALANDNASTYIYRYDLAARKVEQVVRIAGVILGQHGTTALPAKGLDFVLGPDKRIWTGINTGAGVSAVLVIDPATLAVSVQGRLPSAQFRYAFLYNEVYVNGGVKIARIPALSALLAGKSAAAGDRP